MPIRISVFEKGSEKLGLSRVHLYRKVKELAGVTPTDFLRNIRLKKAAALLRRKAGNVNEVAYATGFGSPAYFSKCFKAVYNITPTEYLEKEYILLFDNARYICVTFVHVTRK